LFVSQFLRTNDGIGIAATHCSCIVFFQKAQLSYVFVCCVVAEKYYWKLARDGLSTCLPVLSPLSSLGLCDREQNEPRWLLAGSVLLWLSFGCGLFVCNIVSLLPSMILTFCTQSKAVSNLCSCYLPLSACSRAEERYSPLTVTVNSNSWKLETC
jgi:hypothetical protein